MSPEPIPASDRQEHADADFDTAMRALEAVRRASDEHGIPTGDLKTCIAYLLDGNITGSRRMAAFTLAMELRRLGWDRDKVEATLADWAGKIDWSQRDAQAAATSAFAKKPNGDYRYRPPGLRHTGTTYGQVLAPVCAAVGCPANCPAFSGKFQGPTRETFERFEQRGWRVYFKSQRLRSVLDTYRAICQRETQLGFAPGAWLITTYKDIAAIAEQQDDRWRQLEEACRSRANRVRAGSRFWPSCARPRPITCATCGADTASSQGRCIYYPHKNR